MSVDALTVPANAIAIVGMAGRFPGARTPEELWRLVRDGREAIRRLSEAELRAAGVPAALLADPAYVRAAATLDGMDEFDAGFFGFSPRDASIMDPQHRHFLECAWEALESAGYTPEGFGGAIGVFGGCGMQAYFAQNLLNNPQLMASAGYFLVRHTGNDKDFLTTRVSYQLNLKGPSISVQTACSTSLVAVHLASQSLLNRECDMALAGGVTIELPHGQGYLYDEGEILSPDGHCRAFDAESKGTVFGSGVGLVVLRRLEDAMEAGDHIHAVILASAVNNDGAGKVGYLAPSVDGQAAVVAEAIALAGVDPATITYVETHGTGTPVGDPIEVEALTEAFGRHTSKQHFCAIGSIKTNIGHLDTAAGVAALIKAASAVEHAELPPSLHYQRANPTIPFDESPFFVNTRLQAWRPDGPRRAGVTSLGVGGTNAHLLLEQAPERPRPASPVQPHLLLLSARSESALSAAATRLAAHLSSHPELPLADVAYTLHSGRRAFGHRLAVAADSSEAAIALLNGARDDPRMRRGVAAEAPPPLTFMFAGGGAQHPGMAAGLYATEPVFRAEVDRCLASAAAHVTADLGSLVLLPAGTDSATALERPSLALPALFTIEYALAKLLQSWGLTPDSYIGHSLGEYVAACLAGVMSVDDAIRVVAARGRLFETLPPGMMASVPVSAATLEAGLPAGLSIAAINGPALCVVSGPLDVVQHYIEQLTRRGTESQRLRIAVAAHSTMLDPILDEFRAVMRTVQLQPPSTPFVSNVTGTWIRTDEATNPDYWVTHLRSTVQFAAGLTTVAASTPGRWFIEVGPGTALTSIARLQAPAIQAISTLGRAADATLARASVLSAAGQLWAYGWGLDAQALHHTEHLRRVPLPTYPFEHQRYWIEPSIQRATGTAGAGEDRDVSRWLHVPVWTPATAPPSAPIEARSVWLLCVESESQVPALVAAIRGEGGVPVTVTPGPAFSRDADDRFTIDPTSSADFEAVLHDLMGRQQFPAHVIVAWNLSRQALPERQLLAMMALARALADTGVTTPVRLAVLTRSLQQVQDEPVDGPEQALATGPLAVISAELPHVSTLALDLTGEDLDALITTTEGGAGVARSILSEVTSSARDASVALRDGRRWVQTLRPLPPTVTGPLPVRSGGTYLLTGGLGGIALTLARSLVQNGPVNLVLISRRGLPPRDTWTHWLDTHPADDSTSRAIGQVLDLEARGATVMVGIADVAAVDELNRLMADVTRRFGAVHGVIHAAGVIEDRLIQMKSADDARRVLRPKVTGTLALAEVLEGRDLDFWVNCSSVSAMIGLPGQFDYSAANAFLDAFSRARGGRDGGRTVAIDWQAWRDVGMLADSRQPAANASDDWAPVTAGLLRQTRVADDTTLFRAPLSAKADWVLDEHRLSGGEALLPGTAFVELAVEAARIAVSSPTIEVSELVFLSPFRPGNTDTVTLQVSIDAGSGDLVMTSGDGADLVEHVRGVVKTEGRPAPAPLNLSEIAARCQSRRTPATPNLSHLTVGTHWQGEAEVSLGEGEALARVTLPLALQHEAGSFVVHPALLDVVTACSLWLAPDYVPERDFYVPLSYGRIAVHAPMPASICCHARRRTETGPAEDLAILDLTVTDAAGRIVLDIERFVVRRLAPVSTFGVTTGRRVPRTIDLSQAITAAEGGAAFLQVLRSLPLVQVVVGPRAMADLAAEAAQLAAPHAQGPAPARGREGLAPLIEPRDETERQIASIWQDLLGIDAVGIDDNFFELGGHSLLLAQVGSRIRKVAGSSVPVAQLFEHPTIRHMADYCRRAGKADDEPALVAVPRDRLRRMKTAADRTSI